MPLAVYSGGEKNCWVPAREVNMASGQQRSKSWGVDIAAAIAGITLFIGITGQPVKAHPASTASLAVSSQGDDVIVSRLPERGICPSELGDRLAAIVNRPEFAGAHWGISVQSLANQGTLYAHAADTALIPASNIKLFTTAAAMQIITARSPQALPAFADELEVINRHSHNRRADDLLRTIGGQHAVRSALTPLGVNPDGYQQVDGSGLSRGNRAQPSALVALLTAMHATDDSRMFYNSLPVGGINGTLRNRFKDSPIQGKVHAKTGTLRGVRALSGYLETEAYDTVVFSIVVNQPGQSGRVMLDAIDEMVMQMAQVQACE